MKKLKISAVIIGLAFSFNGTAFAKSDKQACEAYSKIGGFMVATLLPRTMQDFVDMTTGKNPELMTEITEGLVSELNGSELLALSKLGGGDAELLGEAAGQISIQLLMAGKATSKSETVTLMRETCLSLGVDQIISNQKTSRAATASSMQ